MALPVRTTVLMVALLFPAIAAHAFSVDASTSITAVLFVPGFRDSDPAWCSIVSLPPAHRGRIGVSGQSVSLRIRPVRPVKNVDFEFRPLGGVSWEQCRPVAGWNDLASAPAGSLAWDISAIEDGAYELRAVGADETSRDPEPEVVCVEKSGQPLDAEEWYQAASHTWTGRRRFHASRADTVILFDGTTLGLSSGTLSSSETTWIRIVLLPGFDPADGPPGAGLKIPAGGAYRRFEREDGACTFAAPVILGIPYDDRGLASYEPHLGVYRFDPVAREWIREAHTWVDDRGNIAWALVEHFTSFAVFGTIPSAGLAGVVVYPNPYVPWDNRAENGIPFSPGDPGSGIHFSGVTEDVEITVFTVAGQRVSRMRVSGTGGTVRWDAKNDAGRELASGVYLVVLKSASGEVVVRKVMIVR